MENKCPHTLLGSHKFKPRYDKWIYAETDLEEKTYVHDICVRCGKIIRRTDKSTIENSESK